MVSARSFSRFVAVLLLAAFAHEGRAETPAASNDAALRAYLSGNGLLNRGLNELAVAEYRKFLSEHADHTKAPLARYGLSVGLFRLDRHEEALNELAPLRSLAEFDFSAEVWTIAGQCELALQRYEAAAGSFRTVGQRFAGNELADDAAAGAIEALYLAKRYAEAAAECQAFDTRAPQSPLRERVLYFWGVSEVALEKHASAAKRFEEIVTSHGNGPFGEQASILLAQCLQHENLAQRAIEQYRRIVAAGGRFVADALAGLASLLYESGDLDAAAESLDRLARDFPKSPHIPAARLQRGKVWFDQNRFDRALEEFERAAGEAALADEAAFWAAKCELRQDNPAAAAKRLGEAVSRYPESSLLPEITYDRAVALLRANDSGRAIEALAEVRTRYVDHTLAPEALRLLATTEHQLGQYDKSKSYCIAFVAEYAKHPAVAEMAFLAAEDDFLAGEMEGAAAAFKHFLDTYPSDAQAAKAKFRMGLALYRLERFDEAAPWLEQVAGLPDEVFQPATLALGDIHFQRGEWKQAEADLTRYLKAGTDVASADEALLKLGLSRQRQEQYDAALAAYSQLLERHPDSSHRVQATFERGQSLAALKRLDEASSAFESVVSQGRDTPFAAHALHQLGAIAASRGQSDKAAEVYSRLAQTASGGELQADALFQQAQSLTASAKFREAEEAYRQYLGRFPNGAHAAEAGARVAIAVARQDRHKEALDAMQPVDAAALTSSLRAALLYEKGWCLRALQRNDDAAAAFREVVKETLPDGLDLHAMLELGSIESAAGRFDAAEDVLRRLRDALASRSSQATSALAEQCTYRLALAEFELSKFEEAAALFEEYLGRAAKGELVPSASYYAGEAAFKLGRHEKAVGHFTRIVKEFKEDAVFAPTLLRLGECLAALQRWALSEQTFTTYLDRFNDADAAYQARFGLGWARENQKRFDEAIAAYGQVVSTHQGPTAARAQFQIGQCLFAQQKYDDAVRELLKVDILYAYPEWSAAALFEAARCFERLGKTAEAKNHLEQVEEKYKQTQWAAMAAKRISELSAAATVPGR